MRKRLNTLFRISGHQNNRLKTIAKVRFSVEGGQQIYLSLPPEEQEKRGLLQQAWSVLDEQSANKNQHKTKFGHRETKRKEAIMNMLGIKMAARVTGLMTALILIAGGVTGIQAQQGAKGGATKLLELSGRATAPVKQVSDYQPMRCPKCVNEVVERVDRSARGANKPVVLFAKHLCEGCNTTLTVEGHGKAKQNVAIHKCTSCGAETVACCNTRKSTEVATKGMDKKFEVAPLK